MEHQIPDWVMVLIDWLPILLVFGVVAYLFYAASKKSRRIRSTTEQSANEKEPGKRPQLTWQRFLLLWYLFVGLFLWTALKAFSQPWTWTFYQCLFALFVLGIA